MTTWIRCSAPNGKVTHTRMPKLIAQDFQQYLEANRDEIEALTIFYAQPHRRRELTYAMIREVFDRLQNDPASDWPRSESGKPMPYSTNTSVGNRSAN